MLLLTEVLIGLFSTSSGRVGEGGQGTKTNTVYIVREEKYKRGLILNKIDSNFLG